MHLLGGSARWLAAREDVALGRESITGSPEPESTSARIHQRIQPNIDLHIRTSRIYLRELKCTPDSFRTACA